MKEFGYFMISFILLSSLISCTAFMPGRSYISEMEHGEEGSFFTPNKDFPVMAGDNGRYWYTDSERKNRTPASEYEQRRNLESDSIREEKERLEAGLPEEEQALYVSVQNRFQTDSEKVFFLGMPYADKLDYINARGWKEAPRDINSAWENRLAGRQSEIMMGMTKQEVMEAAGRPMKVEVAGNPRYENERWLYNVEGVSKYIYFEAGVVGGWESAR